MTDALALPLSVELDPDTRARLDRLAKSRRSTPPAMLREAIAQYVEREEKREAFRLDTLQAWEDYRTTGLHVTADEADAWLAQLAAGNDIASPECHR